MSSSKKIGLWHSRKGLIISQPYIANGASWRPQPSAFAGGGSSFILDNHKSPGRTMALIRERGLHRHFGDFDDHLEDVTIDWLNNTACIDGGGGGGGGRPEK